MTQEKKWVTAAIPESRFYIVYDPELCTGCQTCELACSAFHGGGRTQPSLSRIQVARNPFEGTIQNFAPKLCYQCQDPKCMPVCPVDGAMTVDEKTGARCIDEEKCDGCKGQPLCFEACAGYYEPPRIIYDHERMIALKCDLCGGNPQCVKWCANRALKYVRLSELKDMGSYEQNFHEPYTKGFGPSYKPYEGHRVTFDKMYPYITRQEKTGK